MKTLNSNLISIPNNALEAAGFKGKKRLYSSVAKDTGSVKRRKKAQDADQKLGVILEQAHLKLMPNRNIRWSEGLPRYLNLKRHVFCLRVSHKSIFKSKHEQIDPMHMQALSLIKEDLEKRKMKTRIVFSKLWFHPLKKSDAINLMTSRIKYYFPEQLNNMQKRVLKKILSESEPFPLFSNVEGDVLTSEQKHLLATNAFIKVAVGAFSEPVMQALSSLKDFGDDLNPLLNSPENQITPRDILKRKFSEKYKHYQNTMMENSDQMMISDCTDMQRL